MPLSGPEMQELIVKLQAQVATYQRDLKKTAKVTDKVAKDIVSAQDKIEAAAEEATATLAKATREYQRSTEGVLTPLKKWQHYQKQLNDQLKLGAISAAGHAKASAELAAQWYRTSDAAGKLGARAQVVTEAARSSTSRWMRAQADLNRMLKRGLISLGTYNAAIEMLAEQYDKNRHEQAAWMEKGRRLTVEVQTAQEVYNASIVELNELLRRGAISEEVFARAVRKARLELLKSARVPKKAAPVVAAAPKRSQADLTLLGRANAIIKSNRTQTSLWMRAQADLNRMYKKGMIDLGTYNRAVEELAEKFDSARIHQRALASEGKALTRSMMTNQERYNEAVRRANFLNMKGVISWETYRRAVKAAKAEFIDTGNQQTRLGKKAAEVAERVRTPMENYKRELADLNRMLKKGLITQRQYNIALKQTQAGFSRAQIEANKLGRSFRLVGYHVRQMGRELTFFVSLPLGLFASAGVRAFMDFDRAMTRSLAIMDGVTSEMADDMATLAKQVSANSLTPPDEVAASYFYLASAGMSAARSMQSLAFMEKFATAGAFDMSRAVSLLTDAQSALGMKVADNEKNLANMTRVGDVLVKANTLADATTEQFAESLANKAGNALRLVNKSVEEGTAVLAVFADQGTKAQLAGERLAIVLRDLQRSSIKNAGAWEKMGIEVFDANGKMKHIGVIIANLEARFNGMTDAQKRAALTFLGFQDRSIIGIQSLLGFSHEIMKFERALKSASGTVETVWQRQMQGFAAQMTQAGNRIKILMMEIGHALVPTLEMLVGWVEKATGWFASLDRSTQQQIVQWGLFAVAIGPVMWLLGSVTTGIGALITVLSYGIGVIQKFSWALIASAGAMKKAALAAAALKLAIGAGVIYAIYKMTAALREAVTGDMKAYNESLERAIELNDELKQKESEKHLKKIADLGQIQDPQKQWEAVNAEIEMQTKMVAGLQHQITLAEKEVDRFSGLWNMMVGSKQLDDAERDLDQTKQRAKEHSKHLQNLIDLRAKAEQKLQEIEKGGKPEGFDGMFPEDGELGNLERTVSKYEELRDELQKSIATYGMTRTQLAHYELALENASDAEKQHIANLIAMDEARKSQVDLKKDTDEYIASLKEQIATFGMSSEQAALYKLQMRGMIDPQTIGQAKALMDQLARMEHVKKLQEEGKSLNEKYMSTQQKFIEDQVHLMELYSVGAISVQTYRQAMADLHKEFAKDFVANFKTEGVSAIKADSAQALVDANNQIQVRSAHGALSQMSQAYLAKAAQVAKSRGIQLPTPSSSSLGQKNPLGIRNTKAKSIGGAGGVGAGLAQTQILQDIRDNTAKPPIVFKEAGIYRT